MNVKFFNIFFIALAFLSSCSKDAKDRRCLKSNGKEVSSEMNLSDFNTIKLDGNFKVFLIPDTITKIKIITGENLINNINSDVVDSVLTLSDNNKCRWLRSYDVKKEVYIYFKNLNYLFINKQCDIVGIDTIRTDNFDIIDWGDIGSINISLYCVNFRFTMHAGTGDFIFSGITKNQFLYFHGNGYLNAKNLKSSYCDVTSKTTGNIDVFTNKTLITSLYESGNIIYYGNPLNIKINTKYSTGELIKGE